MQRNWTNIGQEHNGEERQRARLGSAFAQLDWQEIGESGVSMPMMPGEGIKTAIQELRIPKVSHVAHSPELAPFGLYGIRGHYVNGRADVYILDEGSRLVVLASDFHEKGDGE